MQPFNFEIVLNFGLNEKQLFLGFNVHKTSQQHLRYKNYNNCSMTILGAEFRNSISFCVISHAFFAILGLIFFRFANAIHVLTYILTIFYILNF